MPPQQQPWASGKHKPSRRTFAGRVWDDTKRSYTRAARKYPLINLVLQVVFSVLAVVLLVVGMVAQNFLYVLAVALSGLAAEAARRARYIEKERQQRQPRPRPTTAGPRTPPPPQGSAPPPPTGGVILCTGSRKPIDECECATRHIATEAGRKRYGGNLGDPIGKRKQPGKPSGTV